MPLSSEDYATISAFGVTVVTVGLIVVTTWDARLIIRKMLQDEQLSQKQERLLDLRMQKEANRHTEAIVDSILPDEESGEDTL